MQTLSEEVIEKSVAAAVSAIEIYNKPDFRYREETFSILMTNAWELLFKAKMLRDNNENADAIAEFENVTDPSTSKIVRQVKQNRSGNALSVGLGYLLRILYAEANSGLERPCHDNIQALMELRDNAIHFVNRDMNFSRRVQELGMASLQNYVLLIEDWFSYDLSRYNFFSMPLSFYHGYEAIQSSSVNSYSTQMQNLMNYLASVEANASGEEASNYRVTLSLETNLIRSKDAGALPVRYTDDPAAPVMNVREEDVLKSYPLNYQQLTDALESRYKDFIQNQTYHNLRKSVEADRKYCYIRRLYPNRPTSNTVSKYYSAEIFKVFDKHYHK